MTREYFADEHNFVFYVDGLWRIYNGFRQAGSKQGKARPATTDEIVKYENKEQRRVKQKMERKEQDAKDAERLEKVYGFDPRKVGLRPRGWYVEDGMLWITARDGGSNDIDFNAGNYGKFAGSEEDDFDCTYRYYKYLPVETPCT